MITHKFGCANRYTCYIDKYFRLSRKSVFYGQKIRCIDFYNNNIDQGITLVTKCIGKVYAPEDYDCNDWTFIGEPETTVSCNQPATVEMTCATLVNRIPQLIDAPAGYVTTDKYPYNEYCVHPLNTYVKSK